MVGTLGEVNLNFIGVTKLKLFVIQRLLTQLKLILKKNTIKKKDMGKIDSTELEFYFFMKGQSGSFHTNLFKTIMSADFGNQYKLAFGFPDEVTVVQRYQKEDGYWQSLQDKFEKKFNENEEA
jgi:hypothetical protein